MESLGHFKVTLKVVDFGLKQAELIRIRLINVSGGNTTQRLPLRNWNPLTVGLGSHVCTCMAGTQLIFFLLDSTGFDERERNPAN